MTIFYFSRWLLSTCLATSSVGTLLQLMNESILSNLKCAILYQSKVKQYIFQYLFIYF